MLPKLCLARPLEPHKQVSTKVCQAFMNDVLAGPLTHQDSPLLCEVGSSGCSKPESPCFLQAADHPRRTSTASGRGSGAGSPLGELTRLADPVRVFLRWK